MSTNPRHILVLTDRDWTHPQGGGTGTVLYGLVAQWLATGHRVTVIAGSYPGADAIERPAPNLVIHRMGTRLTVFARAAWATLRGIGRDADVVLEVCNGIAFNTPFWLWLRKPRLLLVFHVHQSHYELELGTLGVVSAFLLERLPLTLFYSRTPVVTISEDSRAALIELGIAASRIRVTYLGLDRGVLSPGSKSEEPSLVYLGRLKQYKRVELILAMVASLPGVRLEVAGAGEHHQALVDKAAELGISERVTFHGHVTEEQKAELLRRAWLAVNASSAEGWSLAVVEAGASGTPTAALAVGGLQEVIQPGITGLLADSPLQLTEMVSDLLNDRVRLEEMSAAAQARAETFTWEATANDVLSAFPQARPPKRPGPC